MAISVYIQILFLCMVLLSLLLLAMIFYLPQIHVSLIPVGQETLPEQEKSQNLKSFDICWWLSFSYPSGLLVCSLSTAFCRVESFNILHLLRN